jgi:DNA-binding CsgD family transcriptional regulator
MNLFKIILLIIAYTTGIISLSLQIICYLKEIEYKETIVFTVSFLLLIICNTVLEFNVLTKAISTEIFQDAFFFFCLLLALTTPLNIHKERVVKNKEIKSKIVILISLILFVFLLSGTILGYKEIAQSVVTFFLYLSIIYSLILVAKTKPALLVLHREKLEKKLTRNILIFFVLFVSVGLLNEYLKYLPDSLFDGSILISFIFITIAFNKLIDDFRRLSLFASYKRFSPDKLSFYNITSRESEVINFLIKGISYKEIAAKLFISLPTVKTHVSNIYQKMNIKNKVELINLISDN